MTAPAESRAVTVAAGDSVGAATAASPDPASAALPNRRKKDGLGERVEALVRAGDLKQTAKGKAYYVSHRGPAHALDSPEFALLAARILGQQNLPVAPSGGPMKNIIAALATRAVNAPVVSPRLLTSVERADDAEVVAVRVHLGNGMVVRVSSYGWDPVANGHDGHLFVEEEKFTPLVEVRAAMPERLGSIAALAEALLDHLPPPAEDSVLTVREQRAIAAASWFLPFLGGVTTARPITLALGPPGCGKTTTQEIHARLFFGPEGKVGGSASLDRVMKDLAAASVHHSIVIRDDVSALPEGALDALNRIATGTEYALAAFHETLSSVAYQSNAVLNLSAYRPEWLTRADTNSRLLILKYGVPPKTLVTKEQRLARADALRTRVWGETLALLQPLTVREEPMQAETRFDDAEIALRRILRPTGLEGDLVSALAKMEQERERVVRDADPHLDVLAGMASAADVYGRTWLAAELQKQVLARMGVETARGPAGSPEAFGKYLGKLERGGTTAFAIHRYKPGHAGRVFWWIGPRGMRPPEPPPPVLTWGTASEAPAPATGEGDPPGGSGW